ncbi:M16 family metallopeptidase [Oceanibaculum nanhaiense]|uniref:M16 family metallopeptidase n=1 Tax=Oceanibaculum nanhaiense TaxID=1909734 RepID=UPI003D2E3B94
MRTHLSRLLAILPLLAFTLFAVPAQAIEIKRVVSPGGIEAWLVEDHSNPIIALQAGFRGAGSTADPDGKAGLAGMTADLLTEGAGDMDSPAFQKKLADLSISLGFSASQDGISGGLRTLTENRDTAFEMLRLALTQPRFDPEPVARGARPDAGRSETRARAARQHRQPRLLDQRLSRSPLWTARQRYARVCRHADRRRPEAGGRTALLPRQSSGRRGRRHHRGGAGPGA